MLRLTIKEERGKKMEYSTLPCKAKIRDIGNQMCNFQECKMLFKQGSHGKNSGNGGL